MKNIKKAIIIALCLALSATIGFQALDIIGKVQATGADQNGSNSKPTTQELYAREKRIASIMRARDTVSDEKQPSGENQSDLNVQYIRTTWRSIAGAGYPIVTAISSIDELELYFGHYKDTYDSNSRGVGYSDTAVGLQNAIEVYNDDFFANNFLVFVLLEEISGSIRHEVESVDENGEIIVRRMEPEIGTADMALWHIIIELDNRFQPEQFNVNLVTG